MATDNKKKLYDALSKEYDMGTYEQFCKDIADDAKRKKLYDATSEEYDYGDYDKFSTQLGYGKSSSTTTTNADTSTAATSTPLAAAGQPWRPTTADKIRMQYEIGQGVKETTERMSDTVGNVRRMQEHSPMTTEGRSKRKAAEGAARMMGAPTKLMGLTPNAGGDGGQVESRPGNPSSPIPHGVKIEDGKPTTEWLLPDGTLTTDFVEADRAEYNARTARLQHEFVRRMEKNGLNPANKDDIEKQRQQDALDTAQKRVDLRLAENEENVRDLYDKRGEELDAQSGWNDDEGFWSNFVRIVGGAAKRSVTAKAPKPEQGKSEADKAIGTYLTENQVLTDAKKLLETRSLRKSNGFMGGFWNIGNNTRNMAMGARHALGDADLYAGGVVALQKASQLMGIEEKLKQGENLTDAEVSLVYSTMLGQDVAGNIKTPHGYNAAQITVQMFPFMAQMALNPASGLSRAMVTKYGKTGLKKVALTIAGDLAESAVLANTLQGAKTAADAMERYQGEIERDEQGRIIFDGIHNWGEAIYKAEGAAIIENYTEMLGEHFGAIGNAIGRGISKGARKIGAGKVVDAVADMVGKVKATDWAKGISDLESRAHWNGTIGEVLEEEAGIVLNSIFTGDNKISDLWDADQQIDIVLGVGLFGGMVSGIKTAGYPIARHKAKSELRKRDGIGSWRFGEDWGGIREAIEGAEENELSATVGDLVRANAKTQEQARSIVEYAQAVMRARGYDIARASLEAEGGMPPEEQDAEESYDHGVQIAEEGDAQAMNDAKNEYEAQRTKMASTWSEDFADDFEQMDDPAGELRRLRDVYGEEAGQTAADFLNAKMVFDGMLQRVRDDIDGRMAQSDAMIESRQHRESGMIQPATLKVGDRQVYVVNGNVMMTDDGTMIDTANSDESIIIKDAETGKLEFASPKDVLSLEAPIDAEEEKATAREAIRQQMAQEAATQIDGTLNFASGESVLLNDMDDNDVTVTIIGQTADENGMPIEGSVDIQYPDGSIQSMTQEQLQGWADMVAQRRVEQFEAERQAEREAQRQADEEAHNTVAPVVAGEWLIGSGENAINSADYLVKALSGLFPLATSAIERIRNEKRGLLTGSIDSLLSNIDAWDEVMSAIKDTILATYNDREAADILDSILEHPKGAPHRVGQELSARLESLHQRMNENPPIPLDFGEDTTATENTESTPQDESTADDGMIPIDPNLIPTPTMDEEGNIMTPSAEGDTELAPQQTIPEQSARERLAKDENGDPIYESAEPETAWDALMEETEGDEAIAQDVIRQTISEKEDELKALAKQKPQAGLSTKQKIEAAKAKKEEEDGIKASIEHWKRMATTKQRREADERSRRESEARRLAEQRRAQEEAERAERGEAERIKREALNGVPEWAHDTPQDARARGYRRNGADKADRQERVAATEGREIEVKFGEKAMPKGRVALIEAETLQPSHRDGSRNPYHFLDEAQPKERTDAASVASARKIAGNIRPEEITSSVTAYTGAPSVNARGETIQGNNRADALRQMYESHPEQAEKYRQYLKDHAAEFGLTPEQIEGMREPVLVNMLDVDDDEAIRLGQYTAPDTESGGTERIKPKNAVQKMGNKINSFANLLLRSNDDEASLSQLIQNNGMDVLKWMRERNFITDTQYGSAFDSKGNLNEKAADDLKGILYQSIFTGGSTRLEEMFSKLPSKAQRAILGTAFRDYDSAREDRMIEEIQQSIIAYNEMMHYPGFAESTNIESAMTAADAWSRQYAMDEVTGEPYLPSENFSNFPLKVFERIQIKR